MNQRQWLNDQAPGWLQPTSLALASIEAVAIIAQAGLLAWVIHAAVIEQQAMTELWPALAALLGVFILRALTVTVRGSLSARASANVRIKLRGQLYQRLAAAGPQLRTSSGTLISTLVDQVEALDAYFARFLPQLGAAGLIPLAIIIAVTWTNWLAGLLLALAAPLIPLFMILVGMGAEQISQRQQQALGRLSGVFLDRLRGLDEIRRFGAVERESRRLADLIDEFRQRTMRVLRLAFLSSAVLEFFAAVAIASLAIYIGLGLLGYIQFGPAGQLTLASGLFILLLAPEFFAPLRTLAQHWHDRADGLAAAESLQQLLALPAARHPPARICYKRPRSPCPIQIENLSFAWPQRPALFRNLALQVQAGERLLIQGESGCGKSSLISLLAGFIAPGDGRILIDGIDVAELDQRGLAESRAWLGQRPMLFAGTVADNIALGRPDAARYQIEAAAELAGVTAFTRQLALGLDSPVDEDGRGFSGGQAQRVALARILLDPAPLLLLDEPTASLDESSERMIWRAIREAADRHNMTVICASHSPLAGDWANRIIALKDGQLVEVAA